MSYSPRGRKESDMTERVHFHLSYTAFIMLIYFTCTLRVSVINRCWILSNAFPASIERLIQFLPFTLHFVNVALCVDAL